jgi:SAM-dependent methyltransferase
MPKLPPRGALAATGPVDAIDEYYRPGIGWVLRRRLDWVDTELPRPVGRVLQVGYGSGIGQFFLAPASSFSAGIDVHPNGPAVARALRDAGLRTALVRADGQALPFAARSFDTVVIMSALEFIPDPGLALGEALRVLAPGGRLVALRPRVLRWADVLYQFLSGRDPESDFHGGRQRVEAALDRLGGPGDRVRRLRRPAVLPSSLAPYEVVVVDRAPASAGAAVPN